MPFIYAYTDASTWFCKSFLFKTSNLSLLLSCSTIYLYILTCLQQQIRKEKKRNGGSMDDFNKWNCTRVGWLYMLGKDSFWKHYGLSKPHERDWKHDERGFY